MKIIRRRRFFRPYPKPDTRTVKTMAEDNPRGMNWCSDDTIAVCCESKITDEMLETYEIQLSHTLVKNLYHAIAEYERRNGVKANA